MQKINELTKDDLQSYIKGCIEEGWEDEECLCYYCEKYDRTKDCKPGNCHPDADNEDCFETYKEMIMDAIYESRTTYI